MTHMLEIGELALEELLPFYLLDSLLTAKTNISICPRMTS